MAARNKKRKLLLLCDLNGTIVHRTENPISGVRPTLYIRQKYYYLRPDAVSFLKNLSKHYRVCIYSSVMMHNIVVLLNAMDRQWQNYVHKVYDRDFNRPDPNATNEWDTVRDMDKIWKISGYSDRDTVILDNELRKFEKHAANGIVVPEYGMAQVIANSTCLADLQKYLLQLADNAEGDVKDYMSSVPWREGWELATEMEKLRIDSIVWGASMAFFEIKNNSVVYKDKGASGYTVALASLDGHYSNNHQLARLLELGDGKHQLFKDNLPCDYSIAECKYFLSRDSVADK